MKRTRQTVFTVLRICVIVLCAGVFCYSAFQLAKYGLMTLKEKKTEQDLLQYRPPIEDVSSTAERDGTQALPGEPPSADSEEKQESPKYTGLAALQQQNPEIIGWISIPDSRVEYPVLQTGDNAFYLTHNLYRQPLASGSVFMDYRCNFETDFQTILYGHHMKNGTMFADIRACRNEAFFRSHLTGYYTTPQRQYRLEFFAFLVVDASAPIFTVSFEDAAAREALLRYIDETAMYRTELAVTADAHLFSLSTCTYEFDDARAVLVGVVAP